MTTDRLSSEHLDISPDPGVIASMGLFKDLYHEALADVVRRARTRRVEKGRIFSQGDKAPDAGAPPDKGKEPG